MITLRCLNIKTTLDAIGGKWKPLILYLLKDKTYRFSELLREIEGVTQKMLTQQLRQLERDNLVKRKVYAVVPPKVEYSITEFGRTLIPIFVLMDAWARKYKQEG